MRIPDDQSSRSQFAIIDDELEEQLRDILEANDTTDDSIVFKQAKDQYMACMDLAKLEEIGLKPLKDMLKKFGGWPVLEDNWDESNFKWYSNFANIPIMTIIRKNLFCREELIYMFRKNGYSTDYLFDFSIATDLKNSTWRTIYIDQPGLGVSREYIIKGLEEENVRHYFNYMQKVTSTTLLI